MQLIIEKVSSPPGGPYLSRPRLIRVLRESLSTCAATVIIGRAGSGKTILAAEFSTLCDRATVWYRVDAPDADFRVFFRYLVAGIQQQCSWFAPESFNMLSVTDEVQLLAEALVYRLLETEHPPLLIFIEDLHLIYDAPWLVPFFSRLLPLLPVDVHLLITTRTMPPAPLWRLRSKQSLCVIGEAELAFTRQEAIELFESRNLAREQAVRAMDHCNGRALALSLLAEGQTRTRNFTQASDQRRGTASFEREKMTSE